MSAQPTMERYGADVDVDLLRSRAHFDLLAAGPAIARAIRVDLALARAARAHGLTGWDARVLVLVAATPGIRSDQLEATTNANGSAIRRAICHLRDAGLAETPGVRRGERMGVQATRAGITAALDIAAAAHEGWSQ